MRTMLHEDERRWCTSAGGGPPARAFEWGSCRRHLPSGYKSPGYVKTWLFLCLQWPEWWKGVVSLYAAEVCQHVMKCNS